MTADGCQTGLQEHFASLGANCMHSSRRVKGSDLKKDQDMTAAEQTRRRKEMKEKEVKEGDAP